jgi:hypothetical protein
MRSKKTPSNKVGRAIEPIFEPTSKNPTLNNRRDST